MTITLDRYDKNDSRCIGKLTMPGFECYTLEDDEDETKQMGRTAIPKGKYEVVVSFSARFQKLLPLLLNVPNFEGVRIHSGNTEFDTDGCILLGMNRTTETITESRTAIKTFMPLLMDALTKEKVFIEIT